jgi:hypothetical protein
MPFLFSKKISSTRGYLEKLIYSIESSQSLKARCFSSSGNPNGRCEENEVLNS